MKLNQRFLHRVLFKSSSCFHSDQRVDNAESGPGEDSAVRHEHGDEEELHPGHSHLPDREIRRPQNPPRRCEDRGGVGEKQFSHGRQPGKKVPEVELLTDDQWERSTQSLITGAVSELMTDSTKAPFLQSRKVDNSIKHTEMFHSSYKLRENNCCILSVLRKNRISICFLFSRPVSFPP